MQRYMYIIYNQKFMLGYMLFLKEVEQVIKKERRPVLPTVMFEHSRILGQLFWGSSTPALRSLGCI